MMDGALGAVVDVADRARVALVQRLDGNLGDDVPLDSQIDALLGDLEAALNTRFDGRYLFGGSRTDQAPVSLPDPPPSVADPSLYYRGDQVRLSVRADLGVELDDGVTADAPAPFAQLIGALGQAGAAHLADDRLGIATAAAAVEAALGGVAGLRAGVGITAERLESVTEGQRSAVLYLDEVTSSIEDVDLAAALTRIPATRRASRRPTPSPADWLRSRSRTTSADPPSHPEAAPAWRVRHRSTTGRIAGDHHA